MTLCTDPDYLIHKLRINYLRNSDDRAADRIFTFAPIDQLRRNPYIRAENDPYPEMDYCHSPDLRAMLLGGGGPYRAGSGDSGGTASDQSAAQREQQRKIANRMQVRRFGKSAQMSASVNDRSDAGVENTSTARSGATISATQRHDDDDSDDDFGDEDDEVQEKPLFFKRAPKAPEVVVTAAAIGGIAAAVQQHQLAPARGDDASENAPQHRPSDAPAQNTGLLLMASTSHLPPGTPPPRFLGASELEKNLPRPAQRKMSALTSLITKRRSMMSNPLAAEFAGFSGRGDPNGISLKVYLPHSDDNSRPLRITVKHDACVEDAIGFALYQYFDEKRQPMIEPAKNHVVFWNLRICEDDGEIDEDFPALDRNRQIQKFAFDEFALVEATPAQVRINEHLSKQRKPSNERLGAVSGGGPATAVTMNPSDQATDATPAATGDVSAAPSDNGSDAHTKSEQARAQEPKSGTTDPNGSEPAALYRLLKIHVHVSRLVSQTTTVNVPVTMLLADVLSRVCQKWKLNPPDHVLKFAETKLDVPMDRPLESLPGLVELDLVKRGSRMSMADILTAGTNARRMSMASFSSRANLPGGRNGGPGGLNIGGDPFTGMYQRWNVTRRMPMLIGKSERVFAIDGDYIHIMPPDNRNMFDTSIKTASYHIGSVVSCKLNIKTPYRFKLSVFRDRDMKSYDFDATDENESNEIVNRINFLMRLNQGDLPQIIPGTQSTSKYTSSTMAGIIPPAIMGAAHGGGGMGGGMLPPGANLNSAMVVGGGGGAGGNGGGDMGGNANVVHANPGYVVVRRDDEYEFFWA